MTMLVRVTAPHFCAGLTVSAGGSVCDAAPILAWALGKSWRDVSAYMRRRQWQVEEVRTTDNGVAHKVVAIWHGTTVDGRAGERGSNSLRPALETASGAD